MKDFREEVEPVNSVIFLSSRVTMEKSIAGSECRGILFFALVDFIASRAEFPPPTPCRELASRRGTKTSGLAPTVAFLLFFGLALWRTENSYRIT